MTGLQSVGQDGEGMAIRSTALETQFSNALAFSSSELFRRTFEEGMAMVEETATYLDGRGRQESKLLPSKAALAYAGESMRLTTRLMQVASWLLVQRALKEGSMSLAEARDEKYRFTSRNEPASFIADPEDLPREVTALMARCDAIYERVRRLDDSMYGDAEESANVPASQMARLQAAFG